MTSQVSLSKYSAPAEESPPTPVSQEVCQRCCQLTKREERFYCELLGAFLADQTLSQPCDLLEAQK